MKKSATSVLGVLFVCVELCYTWVCPQSIMDKIGHEIPNTTWGKQGRVT